MSKWCGLAAQARRRDPADASSPGIVHWLVDEFGRYPFDATGGVVTALDPGFALENQTRPTYPSSATARARSSSSTSSPTSGSATRCRSQRWRDIWLNEGFATCVEWRVRPRTHGGRSRRRLAATSPTAHAGATRSGGLPIGDPGPDDLFDVAGLRPRRDDAAGAAQPDRRRRRCCDVLRTWVRRPPRRQRHRRGVRAPWPSRSAGRTWTGSSTPGCTPARRPGAHRGQRPAPERPWPRAGRSARWAP